MPVFREEKRISLKSTFFNMISAQWWIKQDPRILHSFHVTKMSCYPCFPATLTSQGTEMTVTMKHFLGTKHQLPQCQKCTCCRWGAQSRDQPVGRDMVERAWQPSLKLQVQVHVLPLKGYDLLGKSWRVLRLDLFFFFKFIRGENLSSRATL